ncbi:MAG: DUF309 domain-containing protein [Trueperaceae bacterium]
MTDIARDPTWSTTIGHFEAGRFWDAHESLEPWWLAAEGTPRAWAAGVILLCAALHKARSMASARGGRRNYAKALRHLAVVPDHFGGTDVRALEATVHAALTDAAIAPRWPWLTQAAA